MFEEFMKEAEHIKEQILEYYSSIVYGKNNYARY